jgi:hypothetical protein
LFEPRAKSRIVSPPPDRRQSLTDRALKLWSAHIRTGLHLRGGARHDEFLEVAGDLHRRLDLWHPWRSFGLFDLPAEEPPYTVPVRGTSGREWSDQNEWREVMAVKRALDAALLKIGG